MTGGYLLLISALTLTFLGGAAVEGKAAACTSAQGQALIDEGRYEQAAQKFTCVINSDPTAVDGYRGRVEAELLLGKFSDAVLDYQRIMAYVLPVHPDAKQTILDDYATRLNADPYSVTALTGAMGARWWFFEYSTAIHLADELLDIDANNLAGNTFRGSSRMLSGSNRVRGAEDLERAISLDPSNPHVRFIAADAYTYGQPDPQRAFDEAMFALNAGLNTPRIHAILAVSYHAFVDELTAAAEIKTHIDLVTTQLVTTAPLASGATSSLQLVPGRSYDIPLSLTAGQSVSIATSSPDFWDTIAVLIAPDGTPVVGSDDAKKYFAAFTYTPLISGVYHLRVTSFESVNTGTLIVKRD